jgi:hypothetical protein
MEHKGENRGSCYPAPRADALAVGVTSIREGERESLSVDVKPKQAADWGFATKKELELIIFLELLEVIHVASITS